MVLCSPRRNISSTRLYRIMWDGFLLNWYWGASIAIQYTAGYTLPTDSGTWTLPVPVERAAIDEAGAYLSRRGQEPVARSIVIEGLGSATYFEPSGSSSLLTPEAEQLLQPYRRPCG